MCTRLPPDLRCPRNHIEGSAGALGGRSRRRDSGAVRAQRDLPTGTVTLLFCDIEGSTALARRLGDAWPAALADHRAVLRRAVDDRGGLELGTEGDGLLAAFPRAGDAIAAAVDAPARAGRAPVARRRSHSRAHGAAHRRADAHARGLRGARHASWRSGHGGRARRPGAPHERGPRDGRRPAPARRDGTRPGQACAPRLPAPRLAVSTGDRRPARQASRRCAPVAGRRRTCRVRPRGSSDASARSRR